MKTQSSGYPPASLPHKVTGHRNPLSLLLYISAPTIKRETTPIPLLHQKMASLASAVTIPSFSGLKSSVAPRAAAATAPAAARASPAPFSARASLRGAAAATVAVAASAMLASSALAAEVLLGGDDGSLAFVPSELSIAAGEQIVFKNNAGFPHNVVFDEDEIPSGVDAAGISMSEEDLLNAPGETYKVTLKEKGTYSFYCSPHQGAGMVGKVTVN